MHRTTLFGIFAVAAASASFAACGSDTGTTGTTGTSISGGGENNGTSTATTTSTTATSSSTSSGSGTGGAGPTLVNGCDPAALEDHTKDATVEIKFGGATIGIAYAPPCIKVKSGTMVTFTGDTSVHPLAGGEVIVGKAATADPNSPIKATTGVATVTFAISPAGSYPYFCTEHYSAGMKGLIVAE
ncbi:MAG: plastocyanin/azurin family copper-binding protein [Byssovorax sp.]